MSEFNEALQQAVQEGDVQMVSDLISQGADPNSLTDKGDRIIELALQYNQLEIVSLLLDHDALLIRESFLKGNLLTWYPKAWIFSDGKIIDQLMSPNKKNSLGSEDIQELFLCVALNGGNIEILKKLRLAGAHIDEGAVDYPRMVDYPTGALALASLAGHLQIVEELLKLGASVNMNRNGYTPLLAAIRGNHPEIVRKLIEAGADINIKNEADETPLMAAALGGATEIVGILLENGAQVNMKNKHGYMPIHQAVKSKNLDTVRTLLSYGADVNARDSETLFIAIYQHQLEMVRLLLERGVNVNVFNHDYGYTPLTAPGIDNQPDVVRELIRYNVDVNRPDKRGKFPLLHFLHSDKSGRCAKLLLENGARADIRENDGTTALMVASYLDSMDVFEDIINQNVDINVLDKDGSSSALMRAVEAGDKEKIRLLLKKGADIDLHTKYMKRTALTVAIECKKADMVKELLKYKLNLNTRDFYGRTPLMLAIDNKLGDVAQILIEKGADIHSVSSRKETALSLASFRGLDEIVHQLLEREALVNHQDRDGNTPLIKAVMSGYQKVVEKLLEYGADVNIRNKENETALAKAILFERDSDGKDIVSLLSARGADVNVFDDHGFTPFLYLLQKNDVDFVKEFFDLFLEKARVNDRDRDGKTALMIAVQRGYDDFIFPLLKQGADIYLKDKQGHTVLDLCSDKNILLYLNDWDLFQKKLSAFCKSSYEDMLSSIREERVLKVFSKFESLHLLLEARAIDSYPRLTEVYKQIRPYAENPQAIKQIQNSFLKTRMRVTDKKISSQRESVVNRIRMFFTSDRCR